MKPNDDKKNLFFNAKKAFIAGNLDEAEELLYKFMKYKPGSPEALKNLTSIYLKRGPTLSSDDKKTVKIVHQLYDEAYLFWQKKNYIPCYELLNQIYNLSKPIPLIEHFLLITKEMISEIEINLEDINNRQSIEQLFNEGLAFYKNGRFDECIQRMMSVLSIDPGHEEAVMYISKATKAMKK